ncbi:glycosyltransferase family 2 protein [Sphingomonas sp.]|uniref:glycosyltransferase family 2 protein n=1 Tax=Sphingomonas sp. TaxID=28214 RepID=UPI003B3B42A6
MYLTAIQAPRRAERIGIVPLPLDHPQAARSPVLAVIIPTLNERDNVGPLFDALCATLADRAWEAVFVDDGSTDGTAEALEGMAARHPNLRLIRRFGRRGLSSAILEGMMATVAPVVAVIDADMQHDEAILPALADAVLAGEADVAVGTRYAGDGSTGEWSASRVKVSAVGTRLAGLVSRTACSDPLSGFFAIRRAAVLDAMPNLSTVGFKILLDLLASSPRPLRVAEVPYRFRCRLAGESKLDSMVAVEYLMLLVDKLIGRWIPPRLVLFAAVGLSGLAVNLLVLGLLLASGLAFQGAQVAAVLVSIVSNFALNNMLTYRDRRLGGTAWLAGLASFVAICGVGAAGQVGVASFLFADHQRWWVAAVAGAMIGMTWNYTVSAFFTWKGADRRAVAA